jgi:hypothetical protein
MFEEKDSLLSDQLHQIPKLLPAPKMLGILKGDPLLHCLSRSIISSSARSMQICQQVGSTGNQDPEAA